MKPIEQVVQETLERLRVNYQGAVLDESDLRSADLDVVLLHNIRADIRLASRAASLLLQVLVSLRATHEVLWDVGSSDRDRGAQVQEDRRLSLDLELYLRQVYELLDAIRILIGKLSAAAPSPSPEVTEELARLKHFRDLLVVHKDRAVRPMRSIVGGRYDQLDVRIGGSLKPISDEDSAQLRAIFQRTSAKLPRAEQKEVNANQQLELLYEHLPKLEPTDRGDVKALIARNGVKSDAPIVLARVVTALAEIYFAGDSR